jgi:hypothetical protein
MGEPRQLGVLILLQGHWIDPLVQEDLPAEARIQVLDVWQHDHSCQSSERLGRDFAGVLETDRPEAVRGQILFTYEDQQAATAQQEAPGQPNRIRCVRDARWKYAVYVDPRRAASPEYELYDLDADPNETRNLLHKSTGSPRTSSGARERSRLHETLAPESERTDTELSM